jgi:glutathione reductase (NADPH)
MSDPYDLLVIGAGSGGVRASRMAGQFGARVAVCEEARLGGTCVNVGCVPKKLFVYGANFAEMFKDAEGFGWSVGRQDFDWAGLVANKDREIKRLNGVYGRIMENAGVDILRGRGHFIDAHTVEVAGQQVRAEHILVATGGKASVPKIPGASLAVTSDDLFQLAALPQRLVVVGGGYIAVEFACIFHNLGVEVSLLYRSDALLRRFDGDIRAFFAEQLVAKGVDLRLNTNVVSIARDADGGLLASLTDGGALHADMVLMATGRHPNTAGLGLEAAGVRTNARGAIVVNDLYQTSAPHIYAVGDVIDRFQLTPVALAEGMAVARNLFGGGAVDGRPVRVDYDNIPTAVFTQPPIGTVGLTEEAARAAHDQVVVYRSRFRPMVHTLSGREERTMMKLVVDGATDRVLGCHMVGPHAAEVIQGFAVAIQCGVTKAQMDRTIGIHPTAAEEFVTMRTPASTD